ncbi:baseplate J/gp47 family protein [Rahnella contaminans]|uniref:baseplate J/gp47 family protein n=1 Tax=Rahnella contaminans TaxID=2703882 RepID=UPI003C307927
MPFDPKSLPQLIGETQADIESRLPGSYARIQKKTLNAVAFGMGGIASGLQSKIAWYARQIIPDESEPAKLAEWCIAFNVPRKLASAASGLLPVTVTAAVTLAQGTRWQRPDGVTVEISEDTTVSAAGQVNVPVKALDTGANGNTPANVTFTIVTPQAGVQSNATTQSALTGGADIEALSRWRDRLIFRMQYPPAGGTLYDYERWALECAGVTRAWAYKGWMGADVGVSFVMDDSDPIIPTTDDVQRVAEYIAGHRDPVTNQWAGQPIGPEVTTFAPTPLIQDIAARLVPNNATTQAAAQAAINQFFTDVQEPGSTLYYSKLAAVISDAAGVTDSTLITPAADVTCEAGELLMPGVCSWQ